MRFAYLIEPPFCFRDKNDLPAGCDVELAQHVCKQLGNEIEFIETEFANLLPGLAKDKWDMTTGLFETAERRKIAAFSEPIWALPDGLLIHTENAYAVAGYGSIAEKRLKLAVVRDQVQHETALDHGVSETSIVVCPTYSEAAQFVANRLVVAYASVARAHYGFLNQNQSLPLTVVRVAASEKPPAIGAFALQLSNPKLVTEVNEILATFIGSREHLEILERYGFSDSKIQLIASLNSNAI